MMDGTDNEDENIVSGTPKIDNYMNSRQPIDS